MSSQLTDFATAFVSLQAAQAASEAMAKATDDAVKRRHQTEILSQIANTYRVLFAAQAEHSELLHRIRELESISEIKSRYELVSLGAKNVVAYAPKQPEPTAASHYLCATCLDGNKIINYLQQTHSSQYRDKFKCKDCGELSVHKGDAPAPSTVRRHYTNRGTTGWAS